MTQVHASSATGAANANPGSLRLFDRFVESVAWTLTHRVLHVIVSTAISIALARVLAPIDYGLLGMVTAVTGILVFTNNFGLNTLIIRRRDITQEFLSTIFWLNLVTGVVVTALVVAGAPLLATYYSDERVVPIARAISLTFTITSLSMVPSALLRRDLRFKAHAVTGIAALAIGGVVSVTLAYRDFGVWSLVAHELVTTTAELALLALVMKWVPAMVVSRAAISELVPFAANMSGQKIVGYIIDNVDLLVIGKLLGPAALGLYSMALRLALHPARVATVPLGQALVPTYAKLGDDCEAIGRYFRGSVRVLHLVLVPAAFVMIAAPDTLVGVVLGVQWTGAAPLLRLFGFFLVLDAFRRMAHGVFLATGHEKELLRIRAVGAALLVPAVIVAAWYGGVVVVATVYVVLNGVVALVQFNYLNKLLGSTSRDFLRAHRGDFVPFATIALWLAASTMIVPGSIGPLIIGIVVYLALVVILNAGSVREYALRARKPMLAAQE